MEAANEEPLAGSDVSDDEGSAASSVVSGSPEEEGQQAPEAPSSPPTHGTVRRSFAVLRFAKSASQREATGASATLPTGSLCTHL